MLTKIRIARIILIMMNQGAGGADAAGRGVFSIREAASHSLKCATCNETITGGGLVGHLGEEVVCDLCLLEKSPKLGMAMALIAVNRLYVVASESAPEDSLAALMELGAFARVYEIFAAKSGPMRTFRLPASAKAALSARDDEDR